MTWIIIFLVVAAILSMAWAFLSSSRLDIAVSELEKRLEARLAQTPTTETESKGAAK
jgi:Tfp pilus assembly protein PilO